MCDYIIRHYWSEKTKSATLEPKWLASGEELTKEQQRIKELYAKTIGNSTYYNNLARTKLLEEVIDSFHIKYTYTDKVDPLDNDSKARGVTDIEMCISKKSANQNKLILFALICILAVGVYVFMHESTTSTFNETFSRELIVAEENISATYLPVNAEISKAKELQNKICARDELNVKLADKICWQFYVKERCNNKAKLSYKTWLESSKEAECTGVTNYSDDDFIEIVKKDKKLKLEEIENFFKGI